MTLREYYNSLLKLVAKHPEWMEFPVTYARDDEGNSYHHVINPPSPVAYESLDEYYLEPTPDDAGSDEGKYNAIIIN